MIRWLSHWLCGLKGHEDMTRFVDRAFYQECLNCGRRTPGIALGRKPRQRFSGDPKRHALRRLVMRRSA